MFTRLKSAFFTLVRLVSSLIAAVPAQATVYNTTVTMSGTHNNRTCLKHYDSGCSAYFLIVALHGGGMTSANAQSEFNLESEQSCVMAVYPQGIDNGWTFTSELGLSQDDAGFVNAVVDEVEATHTIYTDHRTLAGFSAGAFLSLKIHCEGNASTFRNIFAVAGGMSSSVQSGCGSPSSHTKWIQLVHGTGDGYFDGATYCSQPCGVPFGEHLTFG